MKNRAPLLIERSFRAGADYELVVFDRLTGEEQSLLAELREDVGFYGILRPRDGSSRTIRAVDRDTALLWFSVRVPGRLPFFAWDGDSNVAERRITQLVLDGVLEMELDGQYVCGARALHALPHRKEADGTGRLCALSIEALRYGESLQLDDLNELASRLYGFGTVPLSPAWTRRLHGSDAMIDYLGASHGTTLHHCLASHFTRAPDQEGAAWISWSKRSRRAPEAYARTYKLYVSPQPEDLPQSFRELVEVLAEHDHLQFKIGRSVHGVLRSDKLVAYFETEESLQRAAEALAIRLISVTPQGVPFSAEIALGGLLSWGMDPPKSARILSWQGHDSWRFWIVRRLASAMIAAQRGPASEVQPYRYAIERLFLDGIDVDGWMPSTGTWWLA